MLKTWLIRIGVLSIVLLMLLALFADVLFS
jgi:hypothetical protein